MKSKIIALIIFSIFLFGFASPDESQIKSYMEKASKESNKNKRIDYYSNLFLDVEYAESPLGEGESANYDTDPLYRFDKFDCVTFVETVLALSISNNFDDFKRNINDIRYKEEGVDFLYRNHFMTADWIPDNSKFLKDITKETGMGKTRTLELTIEKKNWFLKNHKIDSEKIHDENVSINYIPINSLNYNEIPSGAIINIVRPNIKTKDKIGTNIEVFHTGFAIRGNTGKLLFRHASSKSGVVTEDDFMEYFKQYNDSDGINILVLSDNLNNSNK